MKQDVVVTAKSGVPARGLQQQDFTLSDNKIRRPLAHFKRWTASRLPLTSSFSSLR